jgi:UDP-N-acetylglucosamine transferase subunit ALG13
LSTFVSVGNAVQSFDRLIKAVIDVYVQLPQPVIIQYGNSIVREKNENCNWMDFMSMSEFEQNVKAADLLILHGGAGSLIHAIKAGKVPVVVPRRKSLNEHIDDHQIEFADAFASAGKAVVVYDEKYLINGVEEAMSLQRDIKNKIRDTPRILELVDNAILSIG